MSCPTLTVIDIPIHSLSSDDAMTYYVNKGQKRALKRERLTFEVLVVKGATIYTLSSATVTSGEVTCDARCA